MKVVITSIELKDPFRFFALSYSAMKIVRQLNATKCIRFKKRGWWTKHYTMTLWETEEDMREFATIGAHLQAMKKAHEIAREIRTTTLDTDTLPDWKTAITLLEKGRVIKY
ncbi:MAG: DUF3291 domain-containing protein [Bacteroidia bacterium]